MKRLLFIHHPGTDTVLICPAAGDSGSNELKPKASNVSSGSSEDDSDEEDSREMTGRIYTKAGVEVTRCDLILIYIADQFFPLSCP